MFEEKSFVNELGETIQVGDMVVAVSQGYNKSVRIRRGMYLGVHVARRENSTPRPSVQVVEKLTNYSTGEPYTSTRKTTLPRGRVFLSK